MPVLSLEQACAAVPSDPIWRITVDQYHAMIRAGILQSGDPVEMIEGWLVGRGSKSPPHRIATRSAREAIEALVPPGWYVETQEPITLPDSEPEPDVCVIRGRTRDYTDRHPAARDVALVVEIADATLERDLNLKKRAYARAGIAVYWVVDLPNRVLHCFSSPSPKGEYLECLHYSAGMRVPLMVEGAVAGEISVDALLP